jgi:ABC-type proline/glycine betaine transport system permease subunit
VTVTPVARKTSMGVGVAYPSMSGSNQREYVTNSDVPSSTLHVMAHVGRHIMTSAAMVAARESEWRTVGADRVSPSM